MMNDAIAASAAVALSQRGRAGLMSLGAIQVQSSSLLRDEARRRFDASETGLRLNDTADRPTDATAMRARIAEAKIAAQADPVFRLERFFQRYVAEDKWCRGILAAEERRADIEAARTALPPPEDIGGSLILDETVTPPKFYDDVQFHLQPGGWDGYDLYGHALAHGIYPYIFARGGYAAVPVGDLAVRSREQAFALLPERPWRRLYDMGCGTGVMFMLLHRLFPDAELHGCDLSSSMLRNGHAALARAGVPAHLRQRDARDTGEPDGSFDLVTHFTLAHELPPKATIETFQEAFRLLEPGGAFLLVDPPPYRAVGTFDAVLLEWDHVNRSEPFFSAALLSDWEAALREIGFVDVRSTLLNGTYPWVLTAIRPAD